MAMPSQLERYEAILHWNPANELDGWLAEDGRVPEVAEALGL